ncbi:MAG: Sulfite exporter TauE/SafE [Methanosaeta sp. PtaB.Bin039]|nr:MAG: Sulfite exporter TauE/SafE [Methanosaeta sp. PtaB.Bin039]
MMNEELVLAVTGLAVGLASGMLGVGGCFIMVPVQYWLLLDRGLDSTLAIRSAFGTGLAVALPTAASGAYAHRRRGAVDSRTGMALGGAGIAGALIGGYMAAHLPAEPLRLIFGFVVLVGAARMALLPFCQQDAYKEPSLVQLLAWGFPVGIVSGLSGIGGGVLLVPLMVIFLGFQIRRAVGTSSLAVTLTSMGGLVSYVINGWGIQTISGSLGYVNLTHAAILALTSVPMAQIGTAYSHRLPEKQLRILFVAVMVYISLRMFFGR